MSSTNSYSGIDDRLVASVRHHARRAISKLPGMELEDLEQELMLHAHRRLTCYDPARSDLWTFADRILKNFVANLLASERAKRRGGGCLTASIDDLSPADELILADWTLGGSKPDQLNCLQSVHLRFDLDRGKRLLPAHLRVCCNLLAEHSPSEVARRLKLARGSLYSRMQTIRRALTAAGLQSYFSSAIPAESSASR
ncbi:MAG: hypothetical protein OEU92_10520 [Alphaproteobacteria bacterium]|nr:hypothetical protein [Alphaproteobacteria bacterium]